MAFIFCDGFDAYSSLGDTVNVNKWSSRDNNMLYNTSGGKFNGGYIQSQGGSYGLTKNINVASGNTFYCGFYSSPGGVTGIGPALQINGLTPLYVNTSGQVFLGNNSTTPLATSAAVISSGWHWIEFSINMNGNSTTCALYIDGVLQFSGTYAMSNFPAAAITSYKQLGGNSNGGAWDDVILWDNSGSTFNTFPLGPRRISTLNPNGAGNSTQFTPSSGANYACVSQAYTGTANVSDAGTGNTDTYTQTSLAYTPVGTINAVVVNTYVVNPAGDGTKSYSAKLRSGSTTASATSRVCPANLTNYQDAFVTDSSSAAWTAASVNSAQPGIGD